MPWILVVALMLGGCAGGERWLGANREQVVVEGVPYQVDWIRDERGMDFRLFRNENIVVMPDELIESRRKLWAAEIVARRECGGARIVVEEKTTNGIKFDYARIRCEA
jgi:hypothetical protein